MEPLKKKNNAGCDIRTEYLPPNQYHDSNPHGTGEQTQPI